MARKHKGTAETFDLRPDVAGSPVQIASDKGAASGIGSLDSASRQPLAQNPVVVIDATYVALWSRFI